jgi:hypothetical protein
VAKLGLKDGTICVKAILIRGCLFYKFSRAGGVFFSSIKNSLRAKFKRLKCILSSWAKNLLCVLLMVHNVFTITKCELSKCMNYACVKGIGAKK